VETIWLLKALKPGEHFGFEFVQNIRGHPLQREARAMRPPGRPPLLLVGVDKFGLLVGITHIYEPGAGEQRLALRQVARAASRRADLELVALVVRDEQFFIPSRQLVPVASEGNTNPATGTQDTVKLGQGALKVGKEEDGKAADLRPHDPTSPALLQLRRYFGKTPAAPAQAKIRSLRYSPRANRPSPDG